MEWNVSIAYILKIKEEAKEIGSCSDVRESLAVHVPSLC